MPFYNNARKKLINPVTENLFYNEDFAAFANPKIPVPIDTEDDVNIDTEDNALLFTEGDL